VSNVDAELGKLSRYYVAHVKIYETREDI